MDIASSVLPLALILCAGIFVQAAAGFAGGLLIVPALLWCGYSIPEAQCSLLIATIPQNAWGVWRLRDSVSFREVVWPGTGRVLLLPVGAVTLVSLETLDPTTLRQVVGAVVLAVTCATWIIRPTPRPVIGWFWAWLAFPLSGFFQGMVGMGGPAMVFWVQAHDWETRKARAFLFSMYLTSILPALGVLCWCFPERNAEMMRVGFVTILLVPLLLWATHYGLVLGTRMGRQRLRTVSLCLLTLMGIAGIAAPLIAPR